MKKRMVIITSLILFNFVAVISEENSPNQIVAVSKQNIGAVSKQDIVAVSRQDVVMNSDTGKAIQAKLQKKQEELAKPFNDQVKAVQERESKLIAAQNKPNADATALEFEKRELMLEGQKLQAQAQKIEGMMAELYQEYMKEFEIAYKKVLNDLAEKNKWIIVIPAESADYVSPTVIVTDQVIKALDQYTKEETKKRAEKIQAKAKNNAASA